MTDSPSVSPRMPQATCAVAPDAQAIFCRRRHQPRRPPLARGACGRRPRRRATRCAAGDPDDYGTESVSRPPCRSHSAQDRFNYPSLPSAGATPQGRSTASLGPSDSLGLGKPVSGETAQTPCTAIIGRWLPQRRVRGCAEKCSGDFLTPSPPAEKPTSGQDQNARQCHCDV
jgi:hypothetical protein